MNNNMPEEYYVSPSKELYEANTVYSTNPDGVLLARDAWELTRYTRDDKAAPVGDILNQCTGIPILYGFAEPVEGYADRPQDLISVLHEMGREVIRLSKQVIRLHEQLAQPKQSAPTPQPEKLDVEALKRAVCEKYACHIEVEVSEVRGIIRMLIDHLAATYDFVRKV